jgi:hypothetical protein
MQTFDLLCWPREYQRSRARRAGRVHSATNAPTFPISIRLGQWTIGCSLQNKASHYFELESTPTGTKLKFNPPLSTFEFADRWCIRCRMHPTREAHCCLAVFGGGGKGGRSGMVAHFPRNLSSPTNLAQRSEDRGPRRNSALKTPEVPALRYAPLH